MNVKVLCALFKRNFVAYFSNPTGYVFICLFVLSSSLAAFWPHEFFVSNLANLEQLHLYFPGIMLFFAPAITMGIWADERRQGTDELVLTLPANDLDVVVGKYLAVVSVFCVSLLFSFVSNTLLLSWMGNPDFGLMIANYFGYLCVGLAMLAIGMTASFLTNNVTVSFVIGVLLNAPLVIVGFSFPQLSRLGIPARFEDFGRGIISFSSLAYFLFVAIAALYICMTLIGRRHWLGGRDGSSMLGHYIVRTIAIIVACVGMVYFVSDYDYRRDLTFAQLNSLSPKTAELLTTIHQEPLEDLQKRREDLAKEIKEKEAAVKDDKKGADELVKLKQRNEQLDLEEQRINSPIEIEAFLSKNVSDRYATKRLDLISKLREMESLSRGKLTVTVHDVKPIGKLAEMASEQYGIESREVGIESRGVRSIEDIFLGAVVRSGLKQVVIPFFELGIPVEYELVRAICTVSESKRRTLGVVRTDANLFGGRSDSPMAMMQRPTPPQPILDELRKNYEVVPIDPNDRIVDPDDPDKKKLDVLLVVQPSSLTEPQMRNLSEAMQSGVPTAIFEDPFPCPWFFGGVPGTDAPRRPAQPMHQFARPQPAEPKGDLRQLWRFLGVTMERQRAENDQPHNRHGGFNPPAKSATAIIWQKFNPYPELRPIDFITDEWVFASNNAGDSGFLAFDQDDEISSGMFELMFPFPGAIKQTDLFPASLTFTPLVQTSGRNGRSGYLLPNDAPMGSQMASNRELRRSRTATGDDYVLAARIAGTIDRLVPVDAPAGETSDPPNTKTVSQEISVVIVTDIDLLHGAFLQWRANPEQTGIKLQFQNVPFVLNVIDSLADESRFIEIRKRRQLHGRLTKLQQRLQETVNRDLEDAIEKAQAELDREIDKAEEARKKREEKAQGKLDRKQASGKLTQAEFRTINDAFNMETRIAEKQKAYKLAALQLEFKKTQDQIDARRKRETYEHNDFYKAVAIFAPPLPLMIVALFVFIYRRSREKEGVASSRLR